MPIRRYPFRTSEKILVPSPILPIRVTNPDNGFDFDTFGLVDTGADHTSIPEFIAKSLGHNITAVKPSMGIGAGGTFDVYPHTFQIDVFRTDDKGMVDTDDVVYTIKRRKIGVINGLPFVLLGVGDFLRRFFLAVDYPSRQFSVVGRKSLRSLFS